MAKPHTELPIDLVLDDLACWALDKRTAMPPKEIAWQLISFFNRYVEGTHGQLNCYLRSLDEKV